MGDGTDIEWTDATWNPIRGCSRVSEGCRNCYAERHAARGLPGYEGLTRDGKWSGEARLVPERLDQPLRWKRPRRIFVNSMSDLFHESLSNETIAAIFGVMAAAPQHTFQALTKRPKRMREWFAWVTEQDRAVGKIHGLPFTPGLLTCNMAALSAEAEHHEKGDAGPLHTKFCADPSGPWPLPNVWLGVSVENQAAADERIPLLLETPAAVRFLSCEPLIGSVDVYRFLRWRLGGEPVSERQLGHGDVFCSVPRCLNESPCRDHGVDWVIAGGESGPGARPMHPDWARSLRDQCAAAGVPYFFKQWGEWAPNCLCNLDDGSAGACKTMIERPQPGKLGCMFRCGKKGAGSKLDEREHKAFPGIAT